jgi:Tfp pilus assembly protein PilF
MKTLLVLLLSVPLLCVAGPSGAQDNKSKDYNLLIGEALEAARQGTPTLAKDKLRDVLIHQPDNYRALILLGQIEVQKYGEALEASSSMTPELYFLRAAMAQPQRPEAYLCLADLYYKRGYVDQGDYYMRMAQRADPNSYEAVSLLGQRLEDSGNYAGAMDLYDRALSKFPFDHNFIQRRYAAAAKGGLHPKWTTRIPSGLGGKEGGGTLSVFMDKYPDAFLLDVYRSEAGESVDSLKRYSLPYLGFARCAEDDPVSSGSYADRYEAMIKATPEGIRNYAKLRAELDRIRSRALEKVHTTEGGNREKSKALYDYLKSELFNEYDRQGGESTAQVIDQKKYITVNAAALYALIAQDAKLPVSPVVRPGGLGASTHDGKRAIPIEFATGSTTGLNVDQGFDVSWFDRFNVWTKIGPEPAMSEGLRARMLGEADPDAAVAYQFVNAAAFGMLQAFEDRALKEEKELLAKLRDQFLYKLRERKIELDRAESRFKNEQEGKEREIEAIQARFEREINGLKKEIRDVEARIGMKTSAYLRETVLPLMREARVLSPDTEEFSVRIEDAYLALSRHEVEEIIQRLSDAMEKRRALEREKNLRTMELKAAQKMTSGGSLAAVIESVITEKDNAVKELSQPVPDVWTKEKDLWRKALDRTEKAVSELRCSEALKRRMESFCWAAMQEAERNGDDAMKEEIKTRCRSLPDDAAFIRKYFGAGLSDS